VPQDLPTAHAWIKLADRQETIYANTATILESIEKKMSAEEKKAATKRLKEITATIVKPAHSREVTPLELAVIKQLRMPPSPLQNIEAEPSGLTVSLPGAWRGLTLFTPILDNNIIYLINHEGEVVHRWISDVDVGGAYLLENGNLLCSGNNRDLEAKTLFDPNELNGVVMEYSWDNKLLWKYIISEGLARDDSIEIDPHYWYHHDTERLPNGNTLVMTWRRRMMKEAIKKGRAADSSPNDELWIDSIIEVEKTGLNSGKIVWEWTVWDHIIQDINPDNKETYGEVAAHPERININPNLWMEKLSPKALRKYELQRDIQVAIGIFSGRFLYFWREQQPS